MQEKRNPEAEAALYRKRMEDMEAEKRMINRIQEEEDGKLHAAYGKLEERWDGYGHGDPGLGELLEEERRLFDRFREENEAGLEEIRREALKSMEETEKELHRVNREPCSVPEAAPDAGRKGEGGWG